MYWTSNLRPRGDLEGLGGDAVRGSRQGKKQPFAVYMEGQREAARIRQEVNTTLSEVDIIATPTGSTLGDKCDASDGGYPGSGGAGAVEGGLHKRHREPDGDAGGIGAVRFCVWGTGCRWGCS